MLSENTLVDFRKAAESLYTGKCDIYEYTSVKDAVTKITRKEAHLHAADVPCRLSYSSKTAAKIGGSVTGISQTIKLFLSPDINVKEGSKITVKQDNLTRDYKASGSPAIYPTHQEITLELFKEMA